MADVVLSWANKNKTYMSIYAADLSSFPYLYV